MTIRPLGNRVVVKPQPEPQSGMIVAPEIAKAKPLRGIVVAVGPGDRPADDSARVPPDVSVGDTVLYGKYTGVDLELEGAEILILNANEVLGILTD